MGLEYVLLTSRYNRPSSAQLTAGASESSGKSEI